MILNPNDGFGCGRSVAWEYKALIFIEECKEDCGHLNIDNIIVKVKRPDKNRATLQRMKIKCPFCDNKFEESAKKLTEYLLKFYGIS